MASFETKLLQAISLDHPLPERPNLPGRAAAVLVLFADRERDGEKGPELLLTLRTEHLERHQGQVAFPGGVVDPEDEDAVAAALRETQEEVGLDRATVKVLGTLPKVWTPTGFLITPVVGVLEAQSIVLNPNPDEIAETFWAPLSLLMSPETYRLEQFRASIGKAAPRTYPIHVYQVGMHRVWGATAAIIKNLLDRLLLCEERS